MGSTWSGTSKEEGVRDSLSLLRQVEVPPHGDGADVYRAVWALPDRCALGSASLRAQRAAPAAFPSLSRCALRPPRVTRRVVAHARGSWEELLELVSAEDVRALRDTRPRSLALLIVEV